MECCRVLPDVTEPLQSITELLWNVAGHHGAVTETIDFAHPYTHAMTNPTHHTKQHIDRFTQFPTTTLQSPHWLQRDGPNSPPRLPFPFDDNDSHLIHASLD